MTRTPPDSIAVQPPPAGASATRADARVLRLAIERIRAEKLLIAVLEAVPGVAMVVNEHRQIVAANRRLLDMTGAYQLEDIAGKRPGEAIGCRNAATAPEGCGEGPACYLCGAVRAVHECQATGATITRECRIPLAADEGGAMDAEVVASSATIDDERYTVVAMRDISAEKRRRVLERVFFHDVLNTAGGMRGLVSILCEENGPAAEAEYKTLLGDLADRLIEIVHQQRELCDAESGDLRPRPTYVSITGLLEALRAVFEHHEAARGRHLALVPPPDVEVVTDQNLARRVLENMVKNALEASPPGETVTLTAVDLGGLVALRVHNAGVMSKDVRHQIFQRSFSTKGEGRGIGTYSMRLLGEGYLGGAVSFTSSEGGGTTFEFRVPKIWKGRAADGW